MLCLCPSYIRQKRVGSWEGIQNMFRNETTANKWYIRGDRLGKFQNVWMKVTDVQVLN